MEKGREIAGKGKRKKPGALSLGSLGGGVSISDGSETTAGERYRQRRERGRGVSVCLAVFLAGWLSEQTTVRDRMPGYSTDREQSRAEQQRNSQQRKEGSGEWRRRTRDQKSRKSPKRRKPKEWSGRPSSEEEGSRKKKRLWLLEPAGKKNRPDHRMF